jgi:hypothetical protein
MFPGWIEQLPSDTLTLGSSLLAACRSLLLPNMSLFSCKNDSKQSNQTGNIWLVLKKPLENCVELSFVIATKSQRCVERKYSAIPQPISRNLLMRPFTQDQWIHVELFLEHKSLAQEGQMSIF